MDLRSQVIKAAAERACALAAADAGALTDLLHEEFRWTSHLGETFGREDYVRRNTVGPVRWESQRLDDVDVVVVGEVAVLRAEVSDTVAGGDGPETFRMPMTQVWILDGGRWRCLAGHAGPRRPSA
ncbi:MAG: nuclear transport factor 2 family protein [Nocardioides sp.]